MAARTSSLIPPKYKTKYSVKNWSEYEQGLRNRGDVTIWFGEDAISGWLTYSCAVVSPQPVPRSQPDVSGPRTPSTVGSGSWTA